MARKRGLIFDGGGFPGVKQVGWVEEAEARGIFYERVQGVSVGALNAAKFVESGAQALREYWLHVEEKGPSSVFNFSAWQVAKRILKRCDSILTIENLDKLVHELNMKKVMDSPTELQVVVKNETENCSKVFSSRDPEMVNNPELFRTMIKASAALPGIFPPVLIDGNRLSDGYHFQLNEFKDFDEIVILLNDDPGLTGLVAGGTLWDRITLGQRELMDDFTPIAIENFLFRNPKFNNFSVSSGIDRLLKWGEAFKKFFVEIFRPDLKDGDPDKPDAPKCRLVVVTPNYLIPTLRLHKFNHGDITRAIQESRKQAKEVLDDLHPPEINSPD